MSFAIEDVKTKLPHAILRLDLAGRCTMPHETLCSDLARCDLAEYLMKNRIGRGYFFFNTAKHETMRFVKARICYIELEDNTERDGERSAAERKRLAEDDRESDEALGDGVDGHPKLQREWSVRDCRFWQV